MYRSYLPSAVRITARLAVYRIWITGVGTVSSSTRSPVSARTHRAFRLCQRLRAGGGPWVNVLDPRQKPASVAEWRQRYPAFAVALYPAQVPSEAPVLGLSRSKP